MKTLFVMFFMAAFVLLMVNVCGFITLRGDVDMAMFLRGSIASILTMMLCTFYYSKV